MQSIVEIKNEIHNGAYDSVLVKLYSEKDLDLQKSRYIEAIDSFNKIFPQHQAVMLYSAPGRTEVGGNHTDHQHGMVLAAAVNLDVIAVVGLNHDNVIRVQSQGFDMNVVDLSNLDVLEEEKNTSNAIIRGIVARFKQLGYSVGGFDAYTTSNVLKGSGLSSSAAFEVLIGTILSKEYCDGKVNAVEIAKIGKYSENNYFGKASGLMDQMVSSVGGFVSIDFNDPENPIIEKVNFDFTTCGYALCITDTKGNHADLTPDYVSVPTEMKQVARFFGKDVLREVSMDEFYQSLTKLKNVVSDRAILRAIHFFQDNDRAKEEADALEQGDFELFCKIVKASGDSSFKWLQNIYSSAHPEEQGVSLGLAVSENILKDRGACRVHGGGFAGTIQAFVPLDLVNQYENKMNEIFGPSSCYVLQIRKFGGLKIDKE